jgi:hypothetical protein
VRFNANVNGIIEDCPLTLKAGKTQRTRYLRGVSVKRAADGVQLVWNLHSQAEQFRVRHRVESRHSMPPGTIRMISAASIVWLAVSRRLIDTLFGYAA